MTGFFDTPEWQAMLDERLAELDRDCVEEATFEAFRNRTPFSLLRS